MSTRAAVSGYLLLEVLIAVMIIGLVLPRLLLDAAERVHAVKSIEERMIGGLVARNRLTRIRLAGRIYGDRPERNSEGVDRMAGREWQWRANTEPTEVPGYFRITLEVFTEEGQQQAVAEVVGFYGDQQFAESL